MPDVTAWTPFSWSWSNKWTWLWFLLLDSDETETKQLHPAPSGFVYISHDLLMGVGCDIPEQELSSSLSLVRVRRRLNMTSGPYRLHKTAMRSSVHQLVTFPHQDCAKNPLNKYQKQDWGQATALVEANTQGKKSCSCHRLMLSPEPPHIHYTPRLLPGSLQEWRSKELVQCSTTGKETALFLFDIRFEGQALFSTTF